MDGPEGHPIGRVEPTPRRHDDGDHHLRRRHHTIAYGKTGIGPAIIVISNVAEEPHGAASLAKTRC